MRHPFSRIARLLLDQILDLGSRLRGSPITYIERENIHRDFEQIQDILARWLASIPHEQVIMLFPENKRAQVATMLRIACSLYEFLGKFGDDQ